MRTIKKPTKKENYIGVCQRCGAVMLAYAGELEEEYNTTPYNHGLLSCKECKSLTKFYHVSSREGENIKGIHNV